MNTSKTFERGIVIGLVLAALLLTCSSARAEGAYAPTIPYEFSGHDRLVIDDNESLTFSLFTFHESSNDWMFFLSINNTVDISPYDNFNITMDCAGLDLIQFNTTEYSSWNDDGYLSINFQYYPAQYATAYNHNTFLANFQRCTISASSYVDSFNNNGAYDAVNIDSIPILATVEFLNCTSSSSETITFTRQLETLVNLMSDSWTIGQLAYMIIVIVLAVFMIPISIILILRWVVFKLTGQRLGGGDRQ